jgi:ubiquinone/menaquinone biosynthesis C-methylase UbiE
MNWHARYLRQAAWTRDLRKYLLEQAGCACANRILEVGCGSGAVLSELPKPAARYGLDLDAAALAECRINAPKSLIIRADGHHIPYPDKSFDIAYCHYLLLWVKDPLQVVREMARVSRTSQAGSKSIFWRDAGRDVFSGWDQNCGNRRNSLGRSFAVNGRVG